MTYNKYPHDMSEAMERPAGGLDEKLGYILKSNAAIQVYYDRDSVRDYDRLIPSIRQAFIDAGWLCPSVDGAYHVSSKSFVIHGEDTEVSIDGWMTGPEWLEQFEKQTKGRVWGGRDEEEAELLRDVCLYYERAARRASGLV